MNRLFLVVHTMAGPWSHDAVFSEAQFRELHPLPGGVSDDDYHDALLDRLLKLGAIVPAPQGAIAGPLPTDKVQSVSLAESITGAAQAVNEQRARMQKAVRG